jgi:GTP-binding protein
MITIRSAKFEISNPGYKKCPDVTVPEYAFIGRSNVGKSSLINMLVGKKGLAKTSQTPGKTLLINHFSINNGEWYIVDLPGYGYAARGKAQREALKKLIDEYILYREQMTLLFVLIDIRHAPQKVDLDFFDWIGENGIPFAIIFTKADKLGPVAAQRNVDEYKRRLLTQWEELPPIFVTSSERGSGRDELLAYIEEVNADVAAAKAEE